MNFGLLLSQLPHVQESRVHYDAMLSLQAREPGKLDLALAQLQVCSFA